MSLRVNARISLISKSRKKSFGELPGQADSEVYYFRILSLQMAFSPTILALLQTETTYKLYLPPYAP